MKQPIEPIRSYSPIPNLSPPLRFVAACCRWPHDEVREDRLTAAARSIHDWDAVIALTRAHRVEGLVTEAVRSSALAVPALVERWADDVRRELREQALLEIGETLRVGDALAQAGLAFRVLKGVPLGIAAYGRPAIKHSWDIDVLVAPDDAVAAAERIGALGYVPTKPGRRLSTAEFQRWSAVSKHAEFGSPRGIAVELHWRVTSLPGLLGPIDAQAPARSVVLLAGRTVPTLADAPNLAYLAVHGMAHGWSRLKWLADFSALVSTHSETELDALIEQSRAYPAGAALPAAFAVRSRLLGYPLPAALADAHASGLSELAVSVIAARRADAAIEDDGQAMRAIERICRSLLPGLAYRATYLLRRHRGSEIRLLVALPRGLHWAYWLVRPYSFLRRSVLRSVRSMR